MVRTNHLRCLYDVRKAGTRVPAFLLFLNTPFSNNERNKKYGNLRITLSNSTVITFVTLIFYIILTLTEQELPALKTFETIILDPVVLF